MALLLPPINQHAELRDLSGRSHATRVESVDGGEVSIARPSDLLISSDYGKGTKYDLLWATSSGVHALPVALDAIKKDGLIVVWVLKPTGDTRREQRRNYVRLSLGIPMSMAFIAEEDGVPVKCTLADVSEAALRCVLPMASGEKLEAYLAQAQDSPEQNTVEIRVGFTIDNTAFALNGHVLRTTRVAGPGGKGDEREQVEAIVLFDADEQVASQLRRSVFAEQIRLRNLSPDR